MTGIPPFQITTEVEKLNREISAVEADRRTQKLLQRIEGLEQEIALLKIDLKLSRELAEYWRHVGSGVAEELDTVKEELSRYKWGDAY